jgi:hypothetical protein
MAVAEAVGIAPYLALGTSATPQHTSFVDCHWCDRDEPERVQQAVIAEVALSAPGCRHPIQICQNGLPDNGSRHALCRLVCAQSRALTAISILRLFPLGMFGREIVAESIMSSENEEVS